MIIDKANTVEELLDCISDYIEDNGSESDPLYIHNMVQRYNQSHKDNYIVNYDDHCDIMDIKPANIEGYKILNHISKNSLDIYGYEWSPDLNKMIFLPKYMKNNEKIQFLVHFIWKMSPQFRKYLKECWTKYTKGLKDED